MQDHIKYLIVEDRADWSKALNREVADYFSEMRGLAKQRIKPSTAYDGDQANDQLRDGAFDLVTLDMNLGEGASRSKISGLDVLAQIARNNSAYFVLIITGAVNDPALEKLYGREAASLMRYGALNEAVKCLPAERVRILNKPGDAKVADAMEKIRTQLHSALDQYCNVSLERNIFRPDPRFKGKGRGPWQVRYNGGERLAIPHINGFVLPQTE
jgi:DNA-binding NtrC family response regulator